MDLDLSQEQQLLRDTVARLCVDFNDSTLLRALETDTRGYSADFWQAMAELGLCGMLVEEARGGIGLGMLECALVHEEFGRSLAPSPHFVSSVLAASLLRSCGSEEQRAKWLPGIASGERIVVPAWQELGAAAGLESVRMTLKAQGQGFVLQGEKILVPFANSADAFLVLVRMPDGEPCLALVEAKDVVLRAQPNHADQSLYALRFDAVNLSAGDCLHGGHLAQHWDRALLQGQIAVAAQAIGGAAAMLDMANAYAKERQQFGQPIGAFQSIAHYLADCATEIEGGRYLVYQAAWACDQGEQWEQLTLMARLQACAVFRRVTVTGVQVHGGMGFSSEADPQLYYRRAKHLQLMHWDPRYLEQRIAAEVFA